MRRKLNGLFDAVCTDGEYGLYRFTEFSEDGKMEYTLPLLEGVKINPAGVKCNVPSALPDIWPWICIPDYSDVQKEMSMDPRWDRWVLKCKKAL